MQARYLSESPSDFSGFDNEVLAFQVAEEMYRDGADVIFPAAGNSMLGVVEAAYQLSDDVDRQLWMIGVDDDLFAHLDASDPWRPHILTSMLKRYDRALYTILEEDVGGVVTPGVRWLDLASGAVDVAQSGGFIADIGPQLDDLRARVVSGEIEVPTVPPEKQDEAAEFGLIPEPSG